MCGICGVLDPTRPVSETESVVREMSDSIAHRGPDDSGVWSDSTAGVVLGHRRLAILDVSEAGHQPMISDDDRFVIVFNGEIYNHVSLRAQLAEERSAPAWRGHSDTETLLACFVAWGVEPTLRAAHGMFAIALWDRRESTLILARDRIGEKPLYWSLQGGRLFFGSELKCLQKHPAFRGVVDRGSLALLLRHNCIPAPHSIFESVYKLEPGHLLRLSVADINRGGSESAPYWHVDELTSIAETNPFTGTDEDVVDAVERALSASVKAQMQSDVPLGAFLSGGVDSSAIVAMMQTHASAPVKTFTIGSENAAQDEAVYAKDVARHLGTDHTELYVSAEHALSVIPKLPAIYCEPFGDSSQIPTFLVSELASSEVRVALSGDAGDEVFGGYNRYVDARKVWESANRYPAPVRRLAAAALTSLSPTQWDSLVGIASPVLPSRFTLMMPGDKAHKLAGVLQSRDARSYYRRLTSHWDDPGAIVIGAVEPETLVSADSGPAPKQGMAEWMMALDTRTYLPDDILVKVDRAAMANSLETRTPMLDPDLMELAWTLPFDARIRGRTGKWALREALYRHVPKPLIERPKMGFGVPLDAWLRGPLRDWAESLLDQRRLESEGYFHAQPIRDMWNAHLSGRRNWQHHLWTILMFQAWLDEQR